MGRILSLALVLVLSAPARADNFLVLPYFNRSADRTLDWIGDSLAEAVREALASEDLISLDRNDRNEAYHRLSVRPYKELTKATVLKIGEALDAEQVIYGYFDISPDPAGSKSRGSLKITTYILDLKHVKQGPEFGELGALEDLATLQRHLAWQTIQFVNPKSAPSETEFVRRHPAVRLDAIESYVRGLLADKPEDKHRFFTQAIRLEPNFSQPSFQLGKVHMQQKEYKLAGDYLQKVSPDDVHSREATFLLGLCRFHAGDYAGAQRSFETIAAIVPLNEVFNNLGAAQSRRNDPQAIDSFKKAIEGDERDPTYHFNAGFFLWKQGKFPEAAASFKAVLERDPDDEAAKRLLARCEKASGPRAGDTKTESMERLKANYEESAWWQLKAALQPQRP